MAYPNCNKNKDKFPWMGQVIIQGNKKRKCFKTKKAALQWEEEGKSDNDANTPQQIRSVSCLEWAEKYLQYATGTGGFCEKTVSEKQLAFRELFANEEVDPYEPADSLEPLVILNHLQEQAFSRSGNAANKQRKNLRAAWQFGIKYLNLPLLNPFTYVERFAEERQERYMPTLDEFWKVFDVCATDQDQLMLRMYLETGARREELFRLGWKDVDFKKKSIRLIWRKNKKGQWEEAWLPVRDEFMDLLKVHQKSTGFKTFVFLNTQGSEDQKFWIPYQYRQHWLKGLCELAGVKQFGFHGIRHLFASILAASNTPLVDIQFMLRHKHLSTTQRYIHQLQKGNREVLAALPDFMERLKKSTSKVHQIDSLQMKQSAK